MGKAGEVFAFWIFCWRRNFEIAIYQQKTFYCTIHRIIVHRHVLELGCVSNLVTCLKGLSSENDIKGYFIDKSVLISKI